MIKGGIYTQKNIIQLKKERNLTIYNKMDKIGRNDKLNKPIPERQIPQDSTNINSQTYSQPSKSIEWNGGCQELKMGSWCSMDMKF